MKYNWSSSSVNRWKQRMRGRGISTVMVRDYLNPGHKYSWVSHQVFPQTSRGSHYGVPCFLFWQSLKARAAPHSITVKPDFHGNPEPKLLKDLHYGLLCFFCRMSYIKKKPRKTSKFPKRNPKSTYAKTKMVMMTAGKPSREINAKSLLVKR